MFITGKHIPRRTFLKGTGAMVALPFLDAMVPAGKHWSITKKKIDKGRLIAVEIVHGAAGCTPWGEENHMWSPREVGPSFDLTGTALESLEPFRDYLTVISNTDVRMAEAWRPEEIGGDHFRSSSVFLTQSHPKITEGSDVYAGTSLDQIYASRYGQDTPLPSLQLCIENVDQSGGCAYGYTCVYTDSISWASPTEPLPVIRDPRVVFDQLFGSGGSARERAARRQTNQSILDWVSEKVAELSRDLGAEDQRRLDQYLENVREIERRIEAVEARNTSGEQREMPEAPSGVPDSFDEHVKMMFDLQVLAFESDMTRVFSFKLARDSSARVMPLSGVENGFHPSSHHGHVESRLMDFHEINKYHVSLIPYVLEKLQRVTEGDGSLLDKTLLIYGSPMADGHYHTHRRCPLFIAGGANGQHPGNMHLKAPDGTPMANAMLNMLHMMGLDDLTSFGDSTGVLPLYQRPTAMSALG